MIKFLLLSSFIICSFSLDPQATLSELPDFTPSLVDHLFKEYLMKYNVELMTNFKLTDISSSERRLIFAENLKKILDHNKNPHKTYVKGW